MEWDGSYEWKWWKNAVAHGGWWRLVAFMPLIWLWRLPVCAVRGACRGWHWKRKRKSHHLVSKSRMSKNGRFSCSCSTWFWVVLKFVSACMRTGASNQTRGKAKDCILVQPTNHRASNQTHPLWPWNWCKPRRFGGICDQDEPAEGISKHQQWYIHRWRMVVICPPFCFRVSWSQLSWL